MVSASRTAREFAGVETFAGDGVEMPDNPARLSVPMDSSSIYDISREASCREPLALFSRGVTSSKDEGET